MPWSYNNFNTYISVFVANNFMNSKILDVGPGAGKYSELLKGMYTEIDGVEIFEPNIEKFNLEKDKYDLAIMGDILEHLSIEDSHKTLEYLTGQGTDVLVVVPYEYEQGSVGGNDHEAHLQDDLTHLIMQERYPQLVCLIKDQEIGVYFADHRVR